MVICPTPAQSHQATHPTLTLKVRERYGCSAAWACDADSAAWFWRRIRRSSLNSTGPMSAEPAAVSDYTPTLTCCHRQAAVKIVRYEPPSVAVCCCRHAVQPGAAPHLGGVCIIAAGTGRDKTQGVCCCCCCRLYASCTLRKVPAACVTACWVFVAREDVGSHTSALKLLALAYGA